MTKLNPPMVPGGEVEAGSGKPESAGQQPGGHHFADRNQRSGGDIQRAHRRRHVDQSSTGRWPGLIPPGSPSPDSSRVVYRARQGSATQYELYSVPLAGGTPPTKLGSSLSSGGQVNGNQSPRQQPRRFHKALEHHTSAQRIFRVPLAGSTVTKVNGALTGNRRRVSQYVIAPAGGCVIPIADQDATAWTKYMSRRWPLPARSPS